MGNVVGGCGSATSFSAFCQLEIGKKNESSGFHFVLLSHVGIQQDVPPPFLFLSEHVVNLLAPKFVNSLTDSNEVPISYLQLYIYIYY